MENQSLIAIIPARGGSKRLSRKNILPFFGHPLIAYTVTAAINSKLFEKIFVSTDDPLIGRIGEWYGAEYLARPSELATDDANLIDVAIHLLNTLTDKGAKIGALCQLMPNCPLRCSQDIVEQYKLFERTQRSFQISVIEYRGVYPHWALKNDEFGKGDWLFGSEYLVPSQQFSKVYCPTGAIWWSRVGDFKSQKAFYGNPFHLAPMDANRGIDIDRLDELELAEVLTLGLWERDKVSPLEPITKEPFPEELLNG
ncbi:MAG: acylneuraminate cytidylyltransferase family protein [Rivularia sp. (in: Bacteria)]|nr:acylneuraminate cytidylyltransferase family protein [Rivularia sp. MS3]